MKVNELVEGKIYIGSNGADYKRVGNDILCKHTYGWTKSLLDIFQLLDIDFKEKKEGIDFSKSTSGDKIFVKDKENGDWQEREFLCEYNGKVFTIRKDDDTAYTWKYYKLPEKKELPREEKVNELEKFCDESDICISEGCLLCEHCKKSSLDFHNESDEEINKMYDKIKGE